MLNNIIAYSKFVFLNAKSIKRQNKINAKIPTNNVAAIAKMWKVFDFIFGFIYFVQWKVQICKFLYLFENRFGATSKFSCSFAYFEVEVGLKLKTLIFKVARIENKFAKIRLFKC